MQIRRGDIIRHSMFRDAALYVLDIFIFKTGIYVHTHWVNQGFVDTYFFGEACSTFIGVEDLSNWLKCKDPDAKCIRHVQWEQMGAN
jgi:hypothetical protein